MLGMYGVDKKNASLFSRLFLHVEGHHNVSYRSINDEKDMFHHFAIICQIGCIFEFKYWYNLQQLLARLAAFPRSLRQPFAMVGNRRPIFSVLRKWLRFPKSQIILHNCM